MSLSPLKSDKLHKHVTLLFKPQNLRRGKKVADYGPNFTVVHTTLYFIFWFNIRLQINLTSVCFPRMVRKLNVKNKSHCYSPGCITCVFRYRVIKILTQLVFQLNLANSSAVILQFPKLVRKRLTFHWSYRALIVCSFCDWKILIKSCSRLEWKLCIISTILASAR